MVILAGTAHHSLAYEISKLSNQPLGQVEIDRFQDGEIDVWVGEEVRHQTVVLVQPTVPPVNDSIIELCLLADAVRRHGAAHVIAVVPYFGYGRKERLSRPGEPISAKVIVDLLVSAGVEQLITYDLHAPAIVGFARIPWINLSALPLFTEELKGMIDDQTVVVSPDSGGVKRARDLASQLGLPLGLVEKRRDVWRRDHTETVSASFVDGFEQAIIVDDLISSGGTIHQAAKYLKERGLKKVVACVTHSLASQESMEKLLADNSLDQIIVTDTVPPNHVSSERWRVISVAPSLAASIQHLV